MEEEPKVQTIQSSYKQIYRQILIAFLISLFGIFPIINIIVIFPLSFSYSLKSFKMARVLSKDDKNKRLITLFVSLCVMSGIVFWWVVSVIIFVLTSFNLIEI